MKTKKSKGPDAKERILDVSEELFANGSFASVSVRSVTSKAEVNLSAVNYYFGSKQGLFHAVYVRRATLMNHERLHLLHEADEKAQAEGRDILLSELISAMLTPPIFWLCDEEKGFSVYIRFWRGLTLKNPVIWTKCCGRKWMYLIVSCPISRK